MSRTTKEPTVNVTFNTDLDYTPPSARVHPRILNVELGRFKLEIQEDVSGVLCVGAWKDAKKAADSLFWIELSPGELDDLIGLLSRARDEARALGMPGRHCKPREVIS